MVVVAGSTNKTIVKDYILKFLREKYGEEEVRGNPRSYNTEIGLPLAILYLDSGESSVIKWIKVLLRGTWKALVESKFPSKLVLELGVDKRGDMEYLLGIVRPDVAIITNIEGSYSDTDSSLDDIFEEFRLLVEKVPKEGKILLNFDDQRVSDLANLTEAEVVSYGFNEESKARARNLRVSVAGQSFDFSFRNEKELVEIRKYGRHYVYAWMVAKVIKSIL